MKREKIISFSLALVMTMLTISLIQALLGNKPVTTTLDYNEETHLIFMREEEKLSRDVYITK